MFRCEKAGAVGRSHSLVSDVGPDQQFLHSVFSFEMKNREAPMSLPVRFCLSVLLTVTLDGDGKQIGSITKSAHATHAHHLHHHGGGIQLLHDMLSPFLGYVQIIGPQAISVNR